MNKTKKKNVFFSCGRFRYINTQIKIIQQLLFNHFSRCLSHFQCLLTCQEFKNANTVDIEHKLFAISLFYYSNSIGHKTHHNHFNCMLSLKAEILHFIATGTISCSIYNKQQMLRKNQLKHILFPTKISIAIAIDLNIIFFKSVKIVVIYYWKMIY